MIPMVFCASLAPWPRLYAAAEINCKRRNNRSTGCGAERRNIQYTDSMKTNPKMSPIMGATTMKIRVLVQPCGIVKSIHEVENQRHQNCDQDQQNVGMHGRSGSRLRCCRSRLSALEHDGFEDIGRILGLVGGHFQHLKQLFELDELDRILLGVE